MEDTPPNDRAFSEGMKKAAEHYSQTRKSLNERYENISARIAEKCDKNWLLAKCSSEEDILEECAALCEKPSTIFKSITLPDADTVKNKLTFDI